jgi:squalene-associated FAD-dependent desaturase
MARGTVHIIGAGLSGLSAAVSLADRARKVVLHELARHAGGRCRSYFEPTLGLTIDNGNHLLLSGNYAALAFLKTVGAGDLLVGPDAAELAFADMASGKRWTVRPNMGLLPWWIFSSRRRVPETSASDYLPLARLLTAQGERTLGDVLSCNGTLYDRLLRPVFLAALNTDPPIASAALAGAVVRETLARGGRACRPLVAANGLGAAFIDPAIAYLQRHGVEIRFDHQLRALDLADDHVRTLEFGEDKIDLGPDDAVILAVPGWVAPLLIKDLPVPRKFSAILNAHFKIAAPRGFPRILGVLNAITEWIFTFPDRISVTVSAADRFVESEREPLARRIWSEVAALAGHNGELPPWHIVKERKATFVALPDENARRPAPQTRWRNLLLAGDWTATGLPATIEGAVRSGARAAELLRPRCY